MTSRRFPAAPILLFLLLASFAAAGETPRATSEPAPPPLHGWVDMHAHPMAHLGFGGKLLHGAPDLGIVMSAIPSGAICRTWDVPLTREEASREDRAIHGGFGFFDNRCGDTLRKEFIRGLEGSLGAQAAHQEEGAFGFPEYNLFPAHNDLTHQQMWVGWVERAWQGGLRVMVALAVNNRTVAAAVMGPGDENGDDVASANIQIEQMKVLVGQTPWMEIATTPEQLRQIVGEGKLAIVLGVEIDNPGNMQWDPTVQPGADPASRAFIQSELQAFWDADVRYIFPVHVVDNKFGGTAIYQDQFNLSNFHQTGEFWDIGCAEVGSGITHEFVVGGFDLAYEIIKAKIGILGATPPPPVECDGPQHSGGHVNAAALTPLGEFAIEEMMRLGMLIDVDHMSTAAVQRTLEIAEPLGFPVNAGHNAPRFGPWAEGNENEKTDEDYATIAALGGMIGLGSGSTATQFVETYQYVNPHVDGMQLAIGTDANGLVILPGADPAAPVVYDSSFAPLSDGDQTWNLNTHGVANYGLFADYVRSWPNAGMTASQHAAFFSTAEGFARMWERVETARAAMIPTPPTADAGGPYAVSEGSSVTLDASATSDPNQPAETLTYEWDFDGDGAYDDATGSAPTFAAVDGPATVTVALRVTDDDSMTGTASATVTVQNVAPSAALIQLPPAMVFQGLSASFQFTDVSDPGTADVAAGFDYSADCTDDGTMEVAWSALDTFSCTYPDSGTFTVRGSVRDKDGGVGEATTAVTVLGPGEAMDAIAAMIAALRDGGSLNRGQANALLVKLEHARDLYEAGREDDAVRHVEVLLRQVETFGRTGVLTAAESAELGFWIEQLMASIEAG